MSKLSSFIPRAIVPVRYAPLFNVDISRLPRYMLNNVVSTENYEIKVVTGGVIETKFQPENVIVFDKDYRVVAESLISRLPNGLFLKLPVGSTVILTSVIVDVNTGSTETDTLYDWFSSDLRKFGYTLKDLCGSRPFITTAGLNSLDKIAYKFYNTHDLWWVIAEYNDIFLHEQLEPGILLNIPYSDDVQQYLNTTKSSTPSAFAYKGKKIRL